MKRTTLIRTILAIMIAVTFLATMNGCLAGPGGPGYYRHDGWDHHDDHFDDHHYDH